LTLLALVLLLVAAFFHAAWNYLSKQAGGGAFFVWLFAALAALIYSPLVIGFLIWQQPPIGLAQLGMMCTSAALHTCYFLLLQRAYGRGDLSLVYPIARGTGPLLTTIIAVSFLGERPSLLALLGTFFILSGVFVLSGMPGVGRHRQIRPGGSGVGQALIIGVFIAFYTIWDKQAVSAFLVPPLLLDWADNLGRALFLTPYALRNIGAVRDIWQHHASKAIMVAIFSPISYILVLTAMVVTPVSYVAPTREVSILIGVALGSRFLGEGNMTRRLAGALAILGGIVALTLG
jgi:drug/metabolite transporter (DMT)-like permease